MSDIGSILKDFPTLDEYAKEAGCHPRTLKRWADQVDGFPIVYFGKKPHVNLRRVPEWADKRTRRRNPSRQMAS